MMRMWFFLFLLLFGYVESIIAQQPGWVLRLHGIYPNEIASKLKKTEVERYVDTVSLHSRLQVLVGELHSKGYLEAGIDSLQWKADTIFTWLHLGKVYRWGHIQFTGLEDIEISRLENTFKTNSRTPFNYHRFEQYREKVLYHLENKGYPFARIVPLEIKIQDERVDGTWKVETNSRYVWDSLVMKGTLHLDKRFLYRYLGIRPGKAYSEKNFREIGVRVQRLGFAKELKSAEVEFGRQKARVYTYLDKQPANQFDGILGLLSNNEKSGKLELSGELKLVLVNSFGKGEHIRFHWQKTERKTQKLASRFEYPYLLNSNLGLDAGFKLHKQDTAYLTTDTDLGIQFLSKGGNYLKAFVRFKNSSLLSTESLMGATVLPEFADSRSLLYGFEVHYQDLDYIFNPRKGWHTTIQLGTGDRKVKQNSKLAPELYEGIKLHSFLSDIQWDISYYVPLATRWTIKLRNLGGFLHNTNLFENDLYRFGGLNTLRGFDEETFLASVYSVFNSEIRFLPEKNTAFFLFWDGAYYQKEIFNEQHEDTPWGVGLGISFETGAGIFSLNYALGKQKEQSIQIRSAKIHFGFVSRF